MSSMIEIEVVSLSITTRSLGLYVYSDGRLVDVVTPILPQEKLSFSMERTLSISVRQMQTDTTLTSCSYDSESLESLIKLELEEGEVLIKLDRVEESRQVHGDDELFMSETQGICESFLAEGVEETLEEHESKLRTSEFKFFEKEESFQVYCKKQDTLIQELKDQLNEVTEMYEHEKALKEKEKNKIECLRGEYEEALKKSQNRENSLLKLLEQKDSELGEVFSILTKAKSNTRSLEYENDQYSSLIKKLECEVSTFRMNELHEEVSYLQKLLENSEAKRRELQEALEALGNQDDTQFREELSKIRSEWTEWEENRLNTEAQLSSEIKTLQKENQQLKDKIKKSEEEDIDICIGHILYKLNYNQVLCKIKPNVYTFNGHNLEIVLEDSVPYVKMGTGYMQLEEFLNISIPTEASLSLESDSVSSYRCYKGCSPRTPPLTAENKCLEVLEDSKSSARLLEDTKSSARKRANRTPLGQRTNRTPKSAERRKPFK